jgi:NAD(P)-dependent dehydrogenase (short-subunit alcohol dehydrogenase family)
VRRGTGGVGAGTTWSAADIPDLHGHTVVVTGANTGIGLETAAALAGAGATVVLACRNLQKAAAAKTAIEARRVSGAVEVLQLDLADQRQIAAAADEARERFGRVDRLINNAGVMAIPFSRTADGFETVFATNHLGHFAFAGRLLPALLASPRARVVTVSSMSARVGRIRWDDLFGERSYNKVRAYAQSKLANLLFAFELQARFAAVGADAFSIAAHPGFASTEIGATRSRDAGRERGTRTGVGTRLVPSAAEAARPSLRAATSHDAYGGQYYGPGGTGGIKGAPVALPAPRRALDERARQLLWERSVELTGVDFSLVCPLQVGLRRHE